jgi:hypothetical protein
MKLLTPIARALPSASKSPGARYRLERSVRRRRERLMEDQQVDLLDVELSGALLERVQRFVVSVVADPDLCFHEHVGAVNVQAVDRFADLALVAVSRGGVDVPIPSVERSAHGVTVSSWLDGRTRISLSDTSRGRERANAMSSATSRATIDVCSYICSGGLQLLAQRLRPAVQPHFVAA